MSLQIPKEMFHAPAYQGVDSFLGSCRQRGLALDTVASDLTQYLGLLDGQLATLINKDYADFVELAASVLGTDTLVDSVRASLHRVQAELQVVRDSVESRTCVMQDRQEQIRAAEEEKRTLEKLVNISQSLTNVEGLLAVADDKDELDVNLLRSGALIDRVVTQFTELHFNASRLRNSQFVQSLQPRISRLEKCIEAALKELLLEALSGGEECRELLTRCLRTYTAINRAQVPKEIFRNVIVGPLFAEIITTANLEGGNRTSCDGLASLFDAILNVAENEICPRVPQREGLLMQSAFDEAVEQLSSKLGSNIFATGIPETFHQNLILSQSFLERWERLVLAENAPRELEAFRKSEAFRRWNKSWKIEVYFALRSQETIRAVERELEAIESCKLNSTETFRIEGMRKAFGEMEALWSLSVHLPGLEANLLRLCFQVVARLRTWLILGLPQESDDAKNAAKSQISTPWSNASLAQWIAGFLDSRTLAASLTTTLAMRIQSALKRESLPTPINASLEVCSDEIEQSIVRPLEDHIVQSVTRACTAQLSFVRRISSLCFRQDSAVPDSAMSEVETILAPLDKLLESVPQGALPDATRIDWSRTVATTLLRAYRDVAVEVLVQAQATQKFITQRSKGETPANANGISKVVTQFELDLNRLEQMFESRHIDVSFEEVRNEIAQFRTQ